MNTGWSGGGYGTGERMSIKTTRACIDAVLDGSIKDASFNVDPVFGFETPSSLPGTPVLPRALLVALSHDATASLSAGVPANVTNPRDAWADAGAYDAQRLKLANMFKENFVKCAARPTIAAPRHTSPRRAPPSSERHALPFAAERLAAPQVHRPWGHRLQRLRPAGLERASLVHALTHP